MKTNHFLISLIFCTALLLASCGSAARVGELQNESHSVELGNAESVRVEINMAAGSLQVTGGTDKLLESDFVYNVAKLKPEVRYEDGTLLVGQPDTNGLPVLKGISDFRNEWTLRLDDQVPMNLKVNMGAGTSDLQLTGLSLTGLDIILGAGASKVDLSGDWVHDLDISINTGAADITVQLPKEVGVRVSVDRGPTMVNTSGLRRDGNLYTNATYGVSDVTLHINMQAGIGQINLEVENVNN